MANGRIDEQMKQEREVRYSRKSSVPLRTSRIISDGKLFEPSKGDKAAGFTSGNTLDVISRAKFSRNFS